jgi:hypothetical protein
LQYDGLASRDTVQDTNCASIHADATPPISSTMDVAPDRQRAIEHRNRIDSEQRFTLSVDCMKMWAL